MKNRLLSEFHEKERLKKYHRSSLSQDNIVECVSLNSPLEIAESLVQLTDALKGQWRGSSKSARDLAVNLGCLS